MTPSRLPDVEFFKSINCHNCTEDIFSNANLAVRCEVCPDLILCVPCFALVPSLGAHRADHAYSFFDSGQFELDGISELNVRDLMQLLDLVEVAGLGNWSEVKKVASRSSSVNDLTTDDIQCQFVSIFIDGLLGRRLWPDRARPQLPDESGDDCHDGSRNQLAIDVSALSDRDIFNVGLQLERREFDANPLDHTDELIVADVDFMSHTTDFKSASAKELATLPESPTKIDTLLQEVHVTLVRYYRNRLRLRQLRNGRIFSLGLLGQFFKQSPSLTVRLRAVQAVNVSPADSPTGKGCGDETRPSLPAPTCLSEAVNRVKFVASVMSPESFLDFTAKIAEEGRLRARIKELNVFRRNGIRKLADSVTFKVKKNERRLRKKARSFAAQGCDEAGTESAKCDTSSAADFALLSHDERLLCQTLRLTAAQYLELKTKFVVANSHGISDGPSLVKTEMDVDAATSNAIIGFMSRTGWITAG